MRAVRFPSTILGPLLVLAAAVVLCVLAAVPTRPEAFERRERLLRIAESHEGNARDYARNADGSPDMLRIAAWHEHMRAEFTRAADHPDEPPPRSRPFPPEGWTPADEGP